MNPFCLECDIDLVPSYMKIRGVQVICNQCPKCKEKTFTMEQAKLAAQKVESIAPSKSYRSYVEETGGTLSVTIPKPVADAFNLKGKNVFIRPNLRNNRIEITVEE